MLFTSGCYFPSVPRKASAAQCHTSIKGDRTFFFSRHFGNPGLHKCHVQPWGIACDTAKNELQKSSHSLHDCTILWPVQAFGNVKYFSALQSWAVPRSIQQGAVIDSVSHMHTHTTQLTHSISKLRLTIAITQIRLPDELNIIAWRSLFAFKSGSIFRNQQEDVFFSAWRETSPPAIDKGVRSGVELKVGSRQAKVWEEQVVLFLARSPFSSPAYRR